MAGLCFLPRPYADLVKNLEVFSRWRSMVLQHSVRRPKINEVGEGEGVTGTGACISPWIPQSADCQFRAWPAPSEWPVGTFHPHPYHALLGRLHGGSI